MSVHLMVKISATKILHVKRAKIICHQLMFFVQSLHSLDMFSDVTYRGAEKSLARPGRKQATATEDFEFHISYLQL